MACVGLSPSLFNNFALLLSLWLALLGSVFSAIPLAFASYLTIYPLQLFLPICLISRRSPFALFFVFASTLGIILSFSVWWLESWQFVDGVYWFTLTVKDLTPNIGLFWYFFTEVFSHFRYFFLFCFQLHCFAYVIPATIRLQSVFLFLFVFVIYSND